MKRLSTKANTLIFIVDDSISKEPINKYDPIFNLYETFNKVHFIIPLSTNEKKSYETVHNVLCFIDHIVTNLKIKINKVVLDYNVRNRTSKPDYHLLLDPLNEYPHIRHLWNNEYCINWKTDTKTYICINRARKLEFHNNRYWYLISIAFDTIIMVKRNVEIITDEIKGERLC